MYDIYEDRQREADRIEEDKRQFVCDMVEILSMPAGCRAMKHILMALGYGQYLTLDLAVITKFNFSKALISVMKQANEAETNRIVAQLTR